MVTRPRSSFASQALILGASALAETEAIAEGQKTVPELCFIPYPHALSAHVITEYDVTTIRAVAEAYCSKTVEAKDRALDYCGEAIIQKIPMKGHFDLTDSRAKLTLLYKDYRKGAYFHGASSYEAKTPIVDAMSELNRRVEIGTAHN